ncbi:unnamed protein product [Caenorhabditis sp. 36 PRJEB53466]|nr:unnamed protein product [Caenorhabditis sp. 36 PRJEB53466]
MSIIWKFVGVVPCAALCSRGVGAEYAIVCFQIFVILLLFIGGSVMNLFKYRMKAVADPFYPRLKTAANIAEFSFYILSFAATVLTVASYNDFKNQMEYKKEMQTVPIPRRVPPSLSVAFEYAEGEHEFNFYIRNVTNYPMNQTLHKTESRAVMHLVKGISRKTSVMGWARNITWQDIKEKEPFTYQTLSVVRAPTTIYNEFFTCKVSPREFRNTLLRIQICDIDEYDRNVVVAEMDYWINTHIISQFTQFEMPFPPFAPDIGELELHMAYLPTSERLVVHYSTVTNLKLEDDCREIYVRGVLFVDGRQWEQEESEKRRRAENACTDDGMHFTRKLIFDLDRKYAAKAEVLIHVMQIVDNKKLVVGQVTLSMRHSNQCRQMLQSLRSTVSRVHRLSPSAG